MSSYSDAHVQGIITAQFIIYNRYVQGATLTNSILPPPVNVAQQNSARTHNSNPTFEITADGMQGMMFTRRAINGLSRALRWFYAIRVSLLKWDNQAHRLNVANSKLHLIAVVTGICLYLLYTVNTMCSMVERSVRSSVLGKSDLASNLSWCFFFDTTACGVVCAPIGANETKSWVTPTTFYGSTSSSQVIIYNSVNVDYKVDGGST